MNRHSIIVTMVLLRAALPALADIAYTCASNIDATQAGTCSALNGSSVSGVYSSVFGSNLDASIYIQYGNTGVGQSNFNLTPVTYAQYYAQLPAYSKSLLPGTDPLAGNTDGNIDVTAALANYLGLTANGAETNGIESDGITSCNLGQAGCYNGVITMHDGGGFYYPLSPSDPTVPAGVDFFYVAEHETDEILGTMSCIGGPNSNNCSMDASSTDASPADLFRYSAPGVTTFLGTANGTPAYFSIDGGATAIAQYINAPSLGDYGDWGTLPYKVQDGVVSPGINLDITNDGGSEIAVLNAVGFSAATPEPGTIGLVGVSLGILALIRIWRRQSEHEGGSDERSPPVSQRNIVRNSRVRAP